MNFLELTQDEKDLIGEGLILLMNENKKASPITAKQKRTIAEEMRESEQEDFGPNSRTRKENDELQLTRREFMDKYHHPKCPELNLNPEDNEKFKETWYNYIEKRSKT